MDDALIMGKLQRVANLRHDGQGFARGHAAGGEQLAEIDAVHKFHEEIELAAGFAKFVEGDDAGMIELGERLSLAGEAGGKGRFLADAGREDFQRDNAVQFYLPGLVNGAHAALADEFEDFELRKQFGDVRNGRRDKSGTGVGSALRFHARGEPGLNEAFRAQAHRPIGGERLLATGANSFRFHIVPFTPCLGIPGERLQGKAIKPKISATGNRRIRSSARQDDKQMAEFIIHSPGCDSGPGDLVPQ